MCWILIVEGFIGMVKFVILNCGCGHMNIVISKITIKYEKCGLCSAKCQNCIHGTCCKLQCKTMVKLFIACEWFLCIFSLLVDNFFSDMVLWCCNLLFLVFCHIERKPASRDNKNMSPGGYTVEVTGLSPKATEKDVYDFFAFSGAIEYVEIVR